MTEEKFREMIDHAVHTMATDMGLSVVAGVVTANNPAPMLDVDAMDDIDYLSKQWPYSHEELSDVELTAAAEQLLPKCKTEAFRSLSPEEFAKKLGKYEALKKLS